MGHWIGPAVNDQLVEFEFRKVYGVSASDKKARQQSRSSDELEQPTSTSFMSRWFGKGKVGTFQSSNSQSSQSGSKNDGALKTKVKDDTYKVSIIIGRPVKSSYLWDLIIMIVLVFLATTSFWDTAAPELSSRMSISLTIILTLAAYTSTRPPPIVKCPKLTFQDSYEVVSFMMVTVISIMNVVSVTLCGGENEEAPQYMQDTWQQNTDICDQGWCASRAIDCHFLTVFLVSFIIVSVFMFSMVYRQRLRLSPAVRESEEDEQKVRLEQAESLRKEKESEREMKRQTVAHVRSWGGKPSSPDTSPGRGGASSSSGANLSPPHGLSKTWHGPGMLHS